MKAVWSAKRVRNATSAIEWLVVVKSDSAAVESAARRIGRNPRLGSLRFAYELSVPDLRVMAVGTFPYLLFYLERERSVDVWRLLHTSRDIPASLREPDA